MYVWQHQILTPFHLRNRWRCSQYKIIEEKPKGISKKKKLEHPVLWKYI